MFFKPSPIGLSLTHIVNPKISFPRSNFFIVDSRQDFTLGYFTSPEGFVSFKSKIHACWYFSKVMTGHFVKIITIEITQNSYGLSWYFRKVFFMSIETIIFVLSFLSGQSFARIFNRFSNWSTKSVSQLTSLACLVKVSVIATQIFNLSIFETLFHISLPLCWIWMTEMDRFDSFKRIHVLSRIFFA